MASRRSAPRRWHIYTTRSVFVITDNPEWVSAKRQDAEVRFLAISRDTGEAREARESPAGFQQKLEALASSGGSGKLTPQPCDAVLGCLACEQPSDVVPSSGGSSASGVGGSRPSRQAPVSAQAAFLLVVSESSVAARTGTDTMHEVRQCDALPFSGTAETPSTEVAAAVAGVRQLLEHNFYFSYDLDITRRLQKRSSASAVNSEDLMTGADGRFVWNRRLVEPLLQQEGVSARWFTPVMQGFFQARQLWQGPAEGPSAAPVLWLVARRSCRHQGTRFSARGIDDNGEAANWVETEQVLDLPAEGARVSLVQVRGSAPVFWEQLSGNSGVTLTRGPELNAVGFERHWRSLESEYGTVLFINLLSGAQQKRSTEGVLIDALAEQQSMHRSAGVQILNLDIRSRTSWNDSNVVEVAEKLAKEILTDVAPFGHFEARNGSKPHEQLQVGVVRTNCLDCLDRTNVLQSQLAWVWIARYCQAHGGQLARFATKLDVPPAGSIPPATGLDAVFGAFDFLGGGGAQPQAVVRSPLHEMLCGMWGDLGDALSELYTGAVSTMGATLRQGCTNATSVVEKGFASLSRAYARLGDDAKQDALRLLLGPQRLLRAPRPTEARRAPVGRLVVAAATWNLHGELPVGNMLPTLLHGVCAPVAADGQKADVLVLCCQELIDLTPANVVTLGEGDSAVQADFEDAVASALSKVQGEAFLKVQGVGMVGVYLGVFVAARLKNSVKSVASDRVRVGHHGLAGNKGAVAVRLEVASTSLAALSLHLESGTSSAKANERAANLEDALNRSFKSSAHKNVPSLEQHDLLVLGGDFNFRLSLPEGANLSNTSPLCAEWPSPEADGGASRVGEGAAVPKGKPPESGRLFDEYDELQGSKGCRAGRETLSRFGLVEGPVLFPPTYKLAKGALSYESTRVPAWTDRIFHTKVGAFRRRYCALGGLRHSDHRPVCALLETDLLAVPGEELCMSPSTSSSASPSTAEPTGTLDLLDVGGGGVGAGYPAAPQKFEDALGAPSPSTSSRPANLFGAGQTPARARWKPPSAKVSAANVSEHAASNAGATTLPVSGPANGDAIGVKVCPGSLNIGQLVLAEFRGGWYLANVLKVNNGTCDVAWLRPRADQWESSSEVMQRYLCSTGADETCHGDGIPVATRIRLLGGVALSGTVASESSAQVSAAKATPGDLLGEEQVDLLS